MHSLNLVALLIISVLYGGNDVDAHPRLSNIRKQLNSVEIGVTNIQTVVNITDTNNKYGIYSSTSFGVNVMDYGANPNGTTDNSDAFQKAINFMSSQGGGYVYIPSGHYLFTASITILPGVSLVGTYLVVPVRDYNDGTLFIVHFGRNTNNISNSFINIETMGTLKGVIIYYDEQECNNITVPVQYPPTIRMYGDNTCVEDVQLLNSWIGIWAVIAGRHYISRVYGQPLYIGIYVDQIYDIGRIENVHFWPFFCLNQTYTSVQVTYGRSFVFGRSDWEYVFNTFSFLYAVGYHFIETSNGCTNGNFLGIGADAQWNSSVLVECVQEPGLLVTNGEFTSFQTKQFGFLTDAIPSQVVIIENNTGPVSFESCSFWGPSNNIARLYSSSSTTFNNCQFQGWDEYKNNGSPAIYSQNGNIKIIASNFNSNKKDIELTKGVKTAIITNNYFTGNINITDNSVNSVVTNNINESV